MHFKDKCVNVCDLIIRKELCKTIDGGDGETTKTIEIRFAFNSSALTPFSTEAVH